MFRVKQYAVVFVAFSLLLCSSMGWAAEKRDSVAKKGMVAAAHPDAARVGVEVLKKGGNAVDAAVATAFALFVAEPNASGIAGGGFATVYMAKEDKTYIVDYREVAPAKAYDKFYLDYETKKGVPPKRSIEVGWYSAGVPGMVAGMNELNKRFGTLKWKQVVTPSIGMLEKGIVVDKTLNAWFETLLARLEHAATPDFFTDTFFKDGVPLAIGDKYYNKDLVKTLKLLASKGSDVFYKGELADKIAAEYAKNADGWITKKDLADYKVIMREPIVGTYRGYKVSSVPPPSSGGLSIIQILNMLENFDMKKMGHGTPDSIHATIEAQKLAFADRKEYMGDPAFVNVPMKQLADRAYAAKRAKTIDMAKANTKVGPGDILKETKGSTTSLSVIDKDGNMVTITHSINGIFGALAVPNGTGILMNNHMDDFSPKPGLANSVAAGKRPLSSMSPTLISKDGKPFMTLGSPGGPRIIAAVSNVIINVIDYGMDIQSANNAPRFFNPNTPKTAVEKRFSEELLTALKAKGQEPDVRKDVDPYFGGLQGIMVMPDGSLHGCGDIRRSGVGLGY